MTQLLELIKQDQLDARKAKNQPIKVRLLTTLIGEATPGGNGVVNDADVLATIAKFLKNNLITQTAKPQDKTLKAEELILRSYMPQELTGDALEELIKRCIADVRATSMRDMGKIMGKLKKENFTIYMSEAQNKIKKLLA
jgi:uncharacterized protein YqeY